MAGEPTRVPPWSRRWLWAAAAAAVAMATFAPTLDFPFVNWDDPDLIVENPRVVSHSPLRLFAEPSGAYLPVRDLAWSLTRRVAGMRPWAFHAANVACHAAASALLALLVAELFGSVAVAAVAALVFAVHPLHVEPVAWASGLKDPLSAALMFAAFLLWVRAVSGKAKRGGAAMTAALVLCWAAALAKASALVLPGLMVLYALALAPDRRKALRWLAPFAVLAGLLAAVAMQVGEASGAVKVRADSATTVVLSMARIVLSYLRQLAVPIGLSPRYPEIRLESLSDPRAVGGLLAVVALYGLWGAVAARRWRRLFFAMGWFLVALLPYVGLVPTSTWQADRYVYVALGGFAMVLGLATEAALGARWARLGAWKNRAVAGLCLAVVGAYAGMAVPQSRLWRSSQALWTRALAVAPKDPLAHYLMGEVLLEELPLEAAKHFEEAYCARLEAAEGHARAAAWARAHRLGGPATRHVALEIQQQRLAADALAYCGTAMLGLGTCTGKQRAYHAHHMAVQLSGGEPRYHYLLARDCVVLLWTSGVTEERPLDEALVHLRCAARGPGWLREQVVADLRRLGQWLLKEGKEAQARRVAEELRSLLSRVPPRTAEP